MRGAQTSAHSINLTLESLWRLDRHDVPASDRSGPGVLGGGPGMMLYTFSELRSQAGYAREQVAAEQHIPLQLILCRVSEDDAGAISCTTAAFRYHSARSHPLTHAHNGILDRADLDRTVDLMVALVRNSTQPASRLRKLRT